MLATIATALLTSLLATGGAWLLAYGRMRREFALHFQAEAAARRLLLQKNYRFRTFKTLSHHLSGFEDDELRKILVQSGAVRFRDASGVEIWGLLDRVKDVLDNETGTFEN